MKVKLAIFSMLFIFLFYLSVFIAGFIPFIAAHKTEISSMLIIDYLKDIINNPIINIKEMYKERNPMLFITLGTSLGLFIYLLFKTRNKDYENVGETYGVQGSSRWAKKHEIFKVPEQITIVPSKEMYDELKRTLKNNEV